LILGVIKTCPKCQKENYIRTGENCPCGYDFQEPIPNKSPDVIVYLGSAEISRRSVEQLYKENLIDDFRRN
jgi:hypothetical protein